MEIFTMCKRVRRDRRGLDQCPVRCWNIFKIVGSVHYWTSPFSLMQRGHALHPHCTLSRPFTVSHLLGKAWGKFIFGFLYSFRSKKLYKLPGMSPLRLEGKKAIISVVSDTSNRAPQLRDRPVLRFFRVFIVKNLTKPLPPERGRSLRFPVNQRNIN